MSDNEDKFMKKLYLQKQIIHLSKLDKTGEYWDDDPLNLQHPFRVAMSTPPNATIINNMINRAIPKFDKIYICHNSNLIKEYDNFKDKDNIVISNVLPTIDWLNNRLLKKLVILDDIDYKNIENKKYITLDRLYGYYSINMSTSCLSFCPNFYTLPIFIKRMNEKFYLFSESNKLI